MYDSFDMACQDEDTALRLNIKVNSENLLPATQKYDLGSLRLPADPSWPKIPQRRLADDVGDLIQPPCIVTLNGTPRRSRTVVRIPQSQSCKLQDCQKAQQPQNQQPKRRSGCTDPRFKKVTTVRSQMTSTDPRDDEIDKQTEINCSTVIVAKECKVIEEEILPWKSVTRAQVVQQAAEKPDETRGTESVGVQTVQTISSSEIISDINQPIKESNKKNSGTAELRRNSCSPVKSARKQIKSEIPRPGSTLPNRTQKNLEINLSAKNDLPQETTNLHNQQAVQRGQGKAVNNLLDGNILDLTTGLNDQCEQQCCDVPVLSYENVPIQISTKAQSKAEIIPVLSNSIIRNFQSPPLFKNIEIPKLELPNDTVPQFLNFEDKLSKSFSSQQVGSLGFQNVGETIFGSQKKLDDSSSPQQTLLENQGKYQAFETCEKNTTSPQRETEYKYVTNESKLQTKENYRLRFKSNPEKLMKNIHNEEKCRPLQNTPNIFKDSVPKHNFHIYCHDDKPFQSCCTNVPQKLSDIQSPQYRTVTTDSEPEGNRNSISQHCKRNGNCSCVQRLSTDSESHVSENENRGSAQVPSNKQKNYSQQSGRLNVSFFDRIDNDKNFQPLNRKGLHFEESEPRTWSPDLKSKSVSIDEQGRGTCLRQKRKMKSEQHLTLNKKRVQSSEPQLITYGRRRSRTPYLKKANSYLSKCTQQLSPDSESTYVYHSEQRRSVSNCGQNENNVAAEGNNLLRSLRHTMQADDKNLIDRKATDTRVTSDPIDLNDAKHGHCTKPYQRPSHQSVAISSFPKSPEAETGVKIEKPTAIPVRTQQLLNRSYWEYYNKLKLDKMENGESPQQQYFCQVAMGAPQLKKRRAPELIVEESNDTSQTDDRVELSLPEIRTLEQCSVLSTMINKTLDSALQPSSETIRTKQIYLNGNMRSSSDPTAGTQSAILKKLFPADNEDSIVSSMIMYKQKLRRDKHFDKTWKLKSIGDHPVVFFGCMVYAMIVFLPMIYDYFSYEEHDEYEDLSYVEIAFKFIIASFKEAFGEFFHMMNKIFFKPDARMQRLSSGTWRRKISKHHLI